jgi:flagellar hook-associated protein 3 FlgL
MIPSLSPSENFFLNGLTRLQSKITTATAQLSSGYRISQPSDAPDQIAPLLQLQAVLCHNRATTSALTRVQADVAGADQAVSSAIQLLDQARSIGAQGASTASSTATRAALAEQVISIQQQMVALANTQSAGRYVFGGDQDASPPYALNLNQPLTVPQNGVDRLFTSPLSATRDIEVSDRAFIRIDQTAQDLFDHRQADDSLASDNVFAALDSLRVALQNDDESGITAAQTSLHAASSWLNSTQGLYGSALNRINAATTQINNENVNLEQQISSIRDTDVVQTAMELTSAETQNQAAMAAEAKLPRTSLFDFLA